MHHCALPTRYCQTREVTDALPARYCQTREVMDHCVLSTRYCQTMYKQSQLYTGDELGMPLEHKLRHVIAAMGTKKIRQVTLVWRSQTHLARKARGGSGDMAVPNLFWRNVEVVSAPPPLYTTN